MKDKKSHQKNSVREREEKVYKQALEKEMQRFLHRKAYGFPFLQKQSSCILQDPLQPHKPHKDKTVVEYSFANKSLLQIGHSQPKQVIPL